MPRLSAYGVHAGAEPDLTKSHECDIRNSVGRGQFRSGVSGSPMTPRRLRKKGRIPP
jgi:hypothetical protein